MPRKHKIRLLTVAAIILIVMLSRSSIQRKLLFHPSHHHSATSLDPWTENGELIGFARKVTTPKNIWLMLHGNAGQAADREYAIPKFSSDDSVFIMEYPGYGQRPGVPGLESFNSAAKQAYLTLRRDFPKTPLCIASESVGSGPACFLATLDPPPDKLVLIAPFNTLASVARDHFPAFIVKLLLTDNWDNPTPLAAYKGPIDIFAATSDTIIHPKHAQALAAANKNARLTLINGDHNDWSFDEDVKIRNP
jgi:uncharacterized protein